MRIKFLVLFCWVGVTVVFAQNKITSFEVTGEIVWAGVDRPGDLFVLLASNELLKYNNQGKQIGKHQFSSRPQIDAGDGVHSFFYLREGQHVGFLSEDLSMHLERDLDPSFAISPWLVCPALRELWILDESDYSFKRTKLRSTTIAFESFLKPSTQRKSEDLVYLREYQNYLFLLDHASGIQLYSSLGKFMRTLGESGLTYFNFLGEELYYKKDNQLLFVDLYTEEKREMSLPQPCNFVLLTDHFMFTVENHKVTVYDFKP